MRHTYLVQKVDVTEVPVQLIRHSGVQCSRDNSSLLHSLLTGNVVSSLVLKLDLLKAFGMSVSGIDVSDSSGGFENAVGHESRAVTSNGVGMPIIELFLNSVGRPFILASNIQELSDTCGTGRTLNTTSDGDGERIGQFQTRILVLDCGVVPVSNVALEDLGDGARIQVQLLVTGGDGVEEGNSSEHDGEVKHLLSVGLQGIVTGLVQRDISRSEIVVRDIEIVLSHEFSLTSGRSNATISQLGWALGLHLHLLHDVPITLGGVGGS